jgi:hypothetical protein
MVQNDKEGAWQAGRMKISERWFLRETGCGGYVGTYVPVCVCVCAHIYIGMSMCAPCVVLQEHEEGT